MCVRLIIYVPLGEGRHARRASLIGKLIKLLREFVDIVSYCFGAC